jgi:PPOX class probable F420-dependent enzyme
MQNNLDQHTYINLETLRKTGVAMKTPVWFVMDGETMYIRTVADSGKVKRARNNSQVRIAPCEADGKLTGEWMNATAREVKDPAIDQLVNKKLDKKYGLMKKVFALMSTLQRRAYTVLEVKIVG